MIVTIMFLGLASCASPKKAPYVKPVISAKTLEVENCEEMFIVISKKHVVSFLEYENAQK